MANNSTRVSTTTEAPPPYTPRQNLFSEASIPNPNPPNTNPNLPIPNLTTRNSSSTDDTVLLYPPQEPHVPYPEPPYEAHLQAPSRLSRSLASAAAIELGTYTNAPGPNRVDLEKAQKEYMKNMERKKKGKVVIVCVCIAVAIVVVTVILGMKYPGSHIRF